MNVHAQSAEPQGSLDRVPFQQIDFDSLQDTGVFQAKPVPIKGYLLVAATSSKAPGAVLNPACEGLLAAGGKEVKVKYQRMARTLWSRGITVLLVDGFNPRGYEETCSHRNKDSSIIRLQDALGGLVYLRSRSDVAGDKIFTVTWGATGGFEGMNKNSPHLKKIGAGFMAAIMYYPECKSMNRSTFAPYAPIQMFVGEKDAWNPAAPCQELSQRQEAGSAAFNIKIYPNTYHSFDQPFGVPKLNAFNPQLGMVGRNADSTFDSYRTIDTFLSGLLTGQSLVTTP